MLVYQLIQQSGNMGTPRRSRHRVGGRADAPRRRHLDQGPQNPEQPAAAAGARVAHKRVPCAAAADAHIPPPQINKCLKLLEQRKLIKAVKSVASSNRKVYMLFELEPSREITGGAWCARFAVRACNCSADASPAGTPGTSMTASSSPCSARSATSTSSAKSAPRWVRMRHHAQSRHALA